MECWKFRKISCMKSWIVIMKNKRLKIGLERNGLYGIAGQTTLYLYIIFNT
ncbi:hypothetical protein HanPSC8_Chr17g0780401 [Helianthus annuus]|nr:hypothetical protein HanPSC8_Chr17g0780401 [Helianthus annuus]